MFVFVQQDCDPWTGDLDELRRIVTRDFADAHYGTLDVPTRPYQVRVVQGEPELVKVIVTPTPYGQWEEDSAEYLYPVLTVTAGSNQLGKWTVKLDGRA